MRIAAYAVGKAKAPLAPFSYDAEPEADEVVIRITHCGICHSDVHLADGDWGEVFPLVPGHEIVGTVERMGADVTGLAEGQRVGLGWQCASCHACEYCTEGKEVFCERNQATCQGHYGGFAERVIADAAFVFPLPDALDSAETAPLLCGGVTVYTPLRSFKNKKVAIIGIGGLGHMALQFAKALGNEVTAISTSKDKEQAAKSFGAAHFTTDPKTLQGGFDLILNTAHKAMDMGLYLGLLRPEGRFVQVGAAPEPLLVPAFGLIMGDKTVEGSSIGHPAVIREMLAFAAAHGIKARIERVPMAECAAALDRTRRNRARYRMVLEN